MVAQTGTLREKKKKANAKMPKTDANNVKCENAKCGRREVGGGGKGKGKIKEKCKNTEIEKRQWETENFLFSSLSLFEVLFMYRKHPSSAPLCNSNFNNNL